MSKQYILNREQYCFSILIHMEIYIQQPRPFIESTINYLRNSLLFGLVITAKAYRFIFVTRKRLPFAH